MIITISCPDPTVAKALQQTIGTIIGAIGGEHTTMETDLHDRREMAPRVHYRATDTDTDHINRTLAKLGAENIVGVVFMDVVNGTIADAVVTERGIREARGLNSKSVQRSLVQLRQAGHIVSQAISTGGI